MEEVPEDWKKANATPLSKKGKKEDLGHYRPAGLPVICRKLVEQIVQEATSSHVKKKMTGTNQHRFAKGKSCLASPAPSVSQRLA